MSELAKNPSTDAPPIVRFDRVSKHFKTSTGTTIALQDINQHIMAGEFVAVIGPSGCGKSTLGRAVLKLIEPQRVGDIREQLQSEIRDLRPTNGTPLYDVTEDPAQKRDLSEDRRRLRALLDELTSFKPRPVAPATAPPLDPELEKQLRALGYLQ